MKYNKNKKFCLKSKKNQKVKKMNSLFPKFSLLICPRKAWWTHLTPLSWILMRLSFTSSTLRRTMMRSLRKMKMIFSTWCDLTATNSCQNFQSIMRQSSSQRRCKTMPIGSWTALITEATSSIASTASIAREKLPKPMARSNKAFRVTKISDSLAEI